MRRARCPSATSGRALPPPGNLGAAFAGCTFNFWTRRDTSDPPKPLKQIDFHLFNYAACDFRGCNFNANNGAAPLVFFNPSAGLTFGACAFSNTNMPAGTFPIAFESPSLVRFEDTRMYDSTMVAPTTSYQVLNSEYSTIADPNGLNALGARQVLASPNYVIEGERLRVIGGTKMKSFAIGAGTLSTTATEGQATFTPTSTEVLQLGDMVYVAPGSAPNNTTYKPQWYDPKGASTDAAQAQSFAGVVLDKTSTTITIGYIPQKLWAALNAGFTLQVEYFARYHPRTYGTSTNAYNTLTSVTPDPSGTNGNFKAGDRVDHLGLPAGAYVINNATANSLTMSTNATSAVSAKPLTDADSVTQVLDGGKDPTVAAIQTNRYPGARKLLWEAKALLTSEFPTRIYATGSSLELTVNARWDGSNWNQDVVGTLLFSSKLDLGSAAPLWYVEGPTGGTAWSESAWDTVKALGAGAASFHKTNTPGTISVATHTVTFLSPALTPAAGYSTILGAYVTVPDFSSFHSYGGLRVTYSDGYVLGPANSSDYSTQGAFDNGGAAQTTARTSTTWASAIARDGTAVVKIEFYIRNPSTSNDTNINVGQFVVDGDQV
jgi:hypothetical protein